MLFYIMLGISSLSVGFLAVGITRTVRSWGKSGETAVSQPYTARKAKPVTRIAAEDQSRHVSRKPADFEFGDWGIAGNRPSRRLATVSQGQIRKPWGW